MMKSKFVRMVPLIDWKGVVAEINRRLKSSYSIQYVQNIYNGRQPSSKIKEILEEILPREDELS